MTFFDEDERTRWLASLADKIKAQTNKVAEALEESEVQGRIRSIIEYYHDRQTEFDRMGQNGDQSQNTHATKQCCQANANTDRLAMSLVECWITVWPDKPICVEEILRLLPLLNGIEEILRQKEVEENVKISDDPHRMKDARIPLDEFKKGKRNAEHLLTRDERTMRGVR